MRVGDTSQTVLWQASDLGAFLVRSVPLWSELWNVGTKQVIEVCMIHWSENGVR